MGSLKGHTRLTLLAGILILIGSPVSAGSCFEDVGCPDNHTIPKAQLWQLGCEPLWTVRNSIYHDHGYCFKTERALSVWGNEGCQYDDAGDIPLNKYERQNISRIKSVEQQKGCP